MNRAQDEAGHCTLSAHSVIYNGYHLVAQSAHAPYDAKLHARPDPPLPWVVKVDLLNKSQTSEHMSSHFSLAP